MDSSLDIHSLAYIDFAVSFLPVAVGGFGKEIANPFVEIADLHRVLLADRFQAESFGRMVGIVVDSTDFAVDMGSNYSLVVVFEKDTVDWMESVDYSFAD
jgi:hypothetical protein